ncbi:flagellar filament capping protein FliD [Paeniglutamicibacter psychrophenolicus]|uniref:Flagellar hook-associated protein 2 n=1 Tax=Paeniglutamicibacter psychrophenolicus TaxID=257454 RepID=A0ABS4WCX6_9MICC|nr:flagellar filament capping protein FliD [Paeniglutamicibacter psychrophenolicus]MBP2374053.1 flagellar hook-associated protein 2 [Paeniglutamicibacter psychrophenolicus]
MGLALDGLASGLDTTALINSLMQVEAIPQNILKNKVSSTKTMVSALQALNTRVADLATLATKLAKPDSLQLFTTAASSEGLKVTASAGASTGSIDLAVDQLATSQVQVTGAITEWDASEFSITVDGAETTIIAASNSLDDIITAVNASDIGVKAVKVSAGQTSDGTEQYKLQFSATETGAANAFKVSIAGTDVPMTVVREARDAEVTLWAGAGSGVEQKITSSSNTFTGLLPGVDVTVSKVSTEAVTVSVERDSKAASNAASGLVDSLNGLFNFIATNSAVTSGAGGATSGMIFTGDSTARDVKQRIMDAAIMPVDGKSPSEIGISITKDGKLEFDAEKFSKALAEDPARVETVLQTISSRVLAVSTAMSDKHDGMITSRIKGQESMISRLDTQVADWDRRLDSREATLKRIYSSLEVQLSNLNSQQSYLASQLASLPTTQKK